MAVDSLSNAFVMLYILGGTSRSGKSTAAKRLLKKAGTTVIPLDSLVMGFTNGFPKVGIHDKLFPDDIARRLWPFLKALCDNLLYVGDDVVLEGEAILPAHARSLMKRYGRKVRCCFLGYGDTTADAKIRQLKTHARAANDWLLDESDAFIASHIGHMIAYSRFLRRECKKHKIRYIDVSHRMTGGIRDAVRFLAGKRR